MIMWRFYVLKILSFARDVPLVLLDGGDELFADGNVVLQVEVVEHGTERHRLGLFHQGETLEELAIVLILAQLLLRFEQGLQDALLRGTAADDVGCRHRYG